MARAYVPWPPRPPSTSTALQLLPRPAPPPGNSTASTTTRARSTLDYSDYNSCARTATSASPTKPSALTCPKYASPALRYHYSACTLTSRFRPWHLRPATRAWPDGSTPPPTVRGSNHYLATTAPLSSKLCRTGSYRTSAAPRSASFGATMTRRSTNLSMIGFASAVGK